MSSLEEAEQKLKFADYLLNRDNIESYLPAIVKHTLQAANKAVAELFGVDEKSSISPYFINKKLSESTAEQEKAFSGYYLELWKLAARPNLTKQDVVKAMKKVRIFVQWVKEEKRKKL